MHLATSVTKVLVDRSRLQEFLLAVRMDWLAPLLPRRPNEEKVMARLFVTGLPTHLHCAQRGEVSQLVSSLDGVVACAD